MKLVRDKYEPAADFTLRHVFSNEEHARLLVDKMHEELNQLVVSHTTDDVALESGDLIEAVIAYCYIRYGVTEEEVTSLRRKKTSRLGGFTNGTVWVEG